MMRIRSWLNQRAIEASESESGNVPVLRKDGTQKWLFLGGFIDERRAANLPKPVQFLKVKAFAVVDDKNQWTDLGEKDYLIGVLRQDKVWIILDGAQPKIIKGKTQNNV
jgi:hypothetical protein